ncbi:MAG: hypothetical protein U0667_17230 [Chloroflexota bacterium]
MTRLLLLAALALLALQARSHLRRRGAGEGPVRLQADAMDAVQPADPVTWPGLVAQWDPWARSTRDLSLMAAGHRDGDATSIDHATPDGDHESVALASFRATQSGPVGPSA